MKHISSFIVFVLLVALLSGCGAPAPAAPTASLPGSAGDQEAAVSNAPDGEGTPAPEGPAAELPEPYQELLDRYALADAERWETGRLVDEGLNILCRYYWENGAQGQLGFLVEDLDGNGTPELLIGIIDGENFTDRLLFDLYTLADGELVTLFQGWERDRWYLLSDGRFYNYGSASSDYSWTGVYTLANGELVFSEGIALRTTNEADFYFRLNPTGEDGEAILNDEAEAQLAAWADSRVQPDFTPLTTLK